MVKAHVASFSGFVKDIVAFLPPGVFLAFATAFIADRKFIGQFRQEFLGSLLMIACTFSAGKWVGSDSMRVAWTSHFLGVIAADYFAGGPHVNPAVTINMWCLGKASYTEAYVRIAAQMAGGLVAFPIYHALSEAMEWEPFGGPEFNMDEVEDHPVEAFLSEFCASFCLFWLIYLLNWELHFGGYHYIIKQGLTAVGIRALIELFPTAGPAMNPMLATAWAVFGVGNKFEFPAEMDHYLVYWVAPGLAAIVASLTYVIFAGGRVFGMKLPVQIKKQAKSKGE
mmetsp:Transcript_8526/g.12364  ORF Transcript_8526/g.12364 Transcript_8526/m.12364 type:complete len:282 (+) Transcript_8526:35-880(+)